MNLLSKRTFVTPEKLPLQLPLAMFNQRVAAFVVDLTILLATIAFLYLLLSTLGVLSGLVMGLFILATFAIRNGYFIFFELYWQGSTPGKRMMGLRVVSRHGGPMHTGSIMARNLLRELEFFLPLQLFLAPQALFPNAPVAMGWLASAWAFLFGLLPLLTRDKLRAGDLLAGTVVIVQPVAKLLEDQAAESPATSAQKDQYKFTEEQLGLYGIRELNVLENILHSEATNPNFYDIAFNVTQKICQKIGWSEPVTYSEVSAFLQAFYLAQRRHLEQRLIMGKRRMRKKEGRLRK